MKTLIAITTTLVLSAFILCVAKAVPAPDLPIAVVKFGDLDATRPAGKEELYRRLTRAAHSVCRSLDPSDSDARLQYITPYKTCIDHAVTDAVARINVPEFTDYVAFRTQKPASADIQLAAR